jgi:hypothetical protein
LIPLSIQEEPVRVRRGDIEALLKEPLFATGIREWSRFRRFGLPHGGGHLQENRLYVRVMEIFEQEYNDFLYSLTGK